MRVLIIKTSSMGDVIHTLPALTDAMRAIPDIKFDWVVEEKFQAISKWHPAVDRVIPIQLRQWKKNKKMKIQIEGHVNGAGNDKEAKNLKIYFQEV